MLRDVPPHLQDRQCNSEPADTGAIAWPHVLQPAKQGPGSGVVSVPQAGHRALRSADTNSFQVLCMQLDNCFIRLYSNVTGQANHLQYHQDGNRQYTRVLVKVSPSNEIMSVVCFRQLGRPNSEFRISQPSGTYYVIRYE